MASNYPTSLDVLTNPTSADNQNTAGVVHSTQHANANDAIEAIEAELGTDPSGSYSTVKARLDAAAPAWTLITSTTITAALVTVTFSSIPQTYTDLLVIGSHLKAGTTAVDPSITVNNDTATRYGRNIVGSESSAALNINGTGAALSLSRDPPTANNPFAFRFRLYDYTLSTANGHHWAEWMMAQKAVQWGGYGNGWYQNVPGAAITRLDVNSGSANGFGAEGTIRLYGVTR